MLKPLGERTLIEIIEDRRSGLPAKSEIESKEKKAFLQKKKRELKKYGKDKLDLISLSSHPPNSQKPHTLSQLSQSEAALNH